MIKTAAGSLLVLTSLAPLPARPAGSDATPLVYLCDPADGMHARLGRSGLLESAGAGKDTILVVTGGALSAAGATPSNAALAGFDVINLAHRDLVDEERLTRALSGSSALFVSASFRMPEETSTPWKTHGIVERGGSRTAFVGIAARSASLSLPGRSTLEGLRHVQPVVAIPAALEEIGDRADRVVLVADAPLSAAARWLAEYEAIDAVLISGRAGLSQLPHADRVHVAPSGGRAVGYTTWEGRSGATRQLLLVESRRARPEITLTEPESGRVTGPEPLDSLAPGTLAHVSLEGANRAIILKLDSVALLDTFGGRAAAEGTRYLIVRATFENVLTPQVMREQLVPVAYVIPKLSDHMYCVANGNRVLAQAQTQGLAGVLPWDQLTLPLPGSKAAGRLLFEVPHDLPTDHLELRFYDFAHGSITLPLVGTEAPDPGEPIVPLQSNEVLDAGVYAYTPSSTHAGGRAPAGMHYVTLELRARSRVTTTASARAFDPSAEPKAEIEIGTVADWDDWLDYTQLVLDGEYAYCPMASDLPEVPRFLPQGMTGGSATFLVPESAKSIELYCGMPNASIPGVGLIRPRALRFALRGTTPALQERETAVSVVDDVLRVQVDHRVTARFAGRTAEQGERFLVLDVTVTNSGKKIEAFQPLRQLEYADARGTQHSADEISLSGPRPPREPLWIPAGERRSFQVAFGIPAEGERARLAYSGWTLAKVFDLPLAETITETVPAVGPEEAATVAEVVRPAGLSELSGTALAGFRPVSITGGGVEWSLLDARLSTECLGTEAPEGQTFLLLQARWRSLDTTQRWKTSQIRQGLFLLRRGLFLESMWHRAFRQEGFVPNFFVLEDETTTATYTVAFAVPETSLQGSSLVFMAPGEDPLILPIAPPHDVRLPVLARAENELLALTVHDIVRPKEEIQEALGSRLNGQRTLVGLRVSLTAKDRPLDLNRIDDRWQLIAEGSFPSPFHWLDETRVEGWPVWVKERWLLPGVTDHGVLLFAVPRSDAALRLELHLDDASPLELQLATGTTRPEPEPRVTLAEQGWRVRLLGLHQRGTEDYPELALDLSVRAPKGEDGRAFGVYHLELMDQSGRTMRRVSIERPYEIYSEFHIPPGATRRMDLRFRLTDPGVRLWLHLPEQCPESLVAIPNPWVPADRERLRSNPILEITQALEEGVPYVPPPLFPEPEPQGIGGIGLPGSEINEAIRRGALYLIDQYPDGFERNEKEDALVILALLHSGELTKHPEVMARAVECLENRTLTDTYDAALTLMGLAFLDPQRFRSRIRRLTQFLVDGQGEKGGWSYLNNEARALEPGSPDSVPGALEEKSRIEVLGGEPIAGWGGTEKTAPVVLERSQPAGAGSGDNSCSQYALLGLQAAHTAGVLAPQDTWGQAASWFVEGHPSSRGWGYGQGGNTYGSMTTAGLAGLAISRFHAGEVEGAQKALREGVDWLARNFSLERNPSSSGWQYYYLYGLERAGRLLGKEFFGPREWYPEGARYLVGEQAGDGSWNGGDGEILDTSFALLFLTRATEELGTREEQEPRTGPGKLTVLSAGTGGSVVFILDASGSMAAELGDQTRFDAARQVVLDVLAGSGAEFEVALRVYGHRYNARHEQANEDSELVVGFGAPDRPELAAALAKLRCRGKTPLTYSLTQALRDLQQVDSDTRRVVLLTDGLESDRNAKPVEAAAALGSAGISLDVVGLCVNNSDLLQRMAAAGGGTCYGASDQGELLRALRTALLGTVSFRVLDPEGQLLAEAESGQEVELPAGPYVVEIELPDGAVQVQAWVHQDRTTLLRIR